MVERRLRLFGILAGLTCFAACWHLIDLGR
jgi:hypothetical protein